MPEYGTQLLLEFAPPSVFTQFLHSFLTSICHLILNSCLSFVTERTEATQFIPENEYYLTVLGQLAVCACNIHNNIMYYAVDELVPRTSE